MSKTKNTRSSVFRRAKALSVDQVENIVKSLRGHSTNPRIRKAWLDVLNDKRQRICMNNKPIHDRAQDKRKQLKKSAKERNIEFNLSLLDVRDMLEKERCEYTGVVLTDHDGFLPTHRSIDRFNPNVGYIQGNVFAVSIAANHAKAACLEHSGCGKMTAKQLLKMCETLCNMGFDELNKV